MFKRILILLTVALVLLLASTAVLADEGGFPWKDHAAPFDYMFNNLIDNHQQSKLVGRGILQGFIYIQFTGEEKDGVPVAIRADCEDGALDCSVGWKFKAVPIKATLKSKGPRVWLVDENDLAAGSRYAHFHWTGTPKKPCDLKIDQTYDGFLMQRIAITNFFWLGGNPDKGHGGHLITPGMDYHSNIVTGWDDSGGNGGHDGGSGGPGGSGGHDGGSCGGHDDETDDGCSGHDDGTDDGCDGHDGGSGGSGGPGGSGGHDGGSCGGHDDGTDDGADGGCSGHDDGTDGGCSGH